MGFLWSAEYSNGLFGRGRISGIDKKVERNRSAKEYSVLIHVYRICALGKTHLTLDWLILYNEIFSTKGLGIVVPIGTRLLLS